MLDLYEVAARLEAEENLKLVYRVITLTNDGQIECEERDGKLLDVAEEANLLYVTHNGEVIWVKLEEVISLDNMD